VCASGPRAKPAAAQRKAKLRRRLKERATAGASRGAGCGCRIAILHFCGTGYGQRSDLDPIQPITEEKVSYERIA
jgi:hypothetical protein